VADATGWNKTGLRLPCAAALPSAIAIFAIAWTQSGAAQDAASAMLAAQIREQGYACGQPIGAERDPALARADSAVWLLSCNDVRYRIRLVPDMAARVERLD
jgi:hypothetical protein